MLWLLSLRSALGAALSFISKPPGIYIAAAIAACLGLWWFGQHEFNSGKRACEKAHAEASAQELARQKAVFIDADKRSTQRTDESEKVNTQNRTIIRVIREQVAAMPDRDDVCISPDTADSLRSLH